MITAVMILALFAIFPVSTLRTFNLVGWGFLGLVGLGLMASLAVG